MSGLFDRAQRNEEVISKPQKGYLYHFKVEIVEGREPSWRLPRRVPKRSLGDTAVAVNPGDPRYARFIGNTVRRPLPVESRAILPVIGDEAVDFEFGTGVLKVTPAHDKADYEIGLPGTDFQSWKSSIGRNAERLAGEDFVGLDRFEARVEAVEKLRELGILVKEEPYENNVGFSDTD